jgi:2-amino-4-hydroxy-6-hydroxymethyldihydropteridine diphosphokinase
MITVYLSLGSNLGDKVDYIAKAIRHIKKIIGVKFQRISSLYLTQPWGIDSNNEFVNCIVEIKTSLEAEELHLLLKDIELKVGRKDFRQNRDREIDIDIIFYGNKIVNKKNLIIPHPRMHKRMFVLQPMMDLCADFRHPLLKKSIQELILLSEDYLKITKLNNVTVD